ncbi:MAG: SagB family peptide dehydrogenase [Treponema sp.]|nr:SagB family peptide dehydrogenase [Treponema sp.]
MKKIETKKILQALVGSESNYSQQSIYPDSAGMDSPDLFMKGKYFSTEDINSQIYLRNYENSYRLGPISGTSEFMAHPENMVALFERRYREEIDGAIMLPKPRILQAKLKYALQTRVSSRNFNGKELSLQELSDFLFYAAGTVKEEMMPLSKSGDAVTRYRRPFPSGGGMYATELYLVIYHVKGITPAVYIYQSISHSLIKYAPVVALHHFVVTERYDRASAAYVPIENFDPAVFICCVNNFNQQRLKYGELSLALAYVDCGCLLQNCSLLAAVLGLEFCIWAGYKKAEAENYLNIDGLDTHVIMTGLLGAGHG